MACFICGESELFTFLDLGAQPPSDAFIRAQDLKKPEATYPLALNRCEDCGLVQLGVVVDPNVLFTEYLYTTGMNNKLRENFKELVERVVRDFKVGEGDLAVDIGSNDGTLLENYRSFGIKVLGVDPSSVAQIAIEKGVPTERDFWSKETAERILATHGQAKSITATNVFAHVPDLDSFMKGIICLLKKDGVFVSESGYLLDMIETLGYDAIYHEHLRYYSLRPLLRLFERFGLEIFQVERIASHNGSLRVYAAQKGVYQRDGSVDALLRVEENAGLDNRETYTTFAQRVVEHRKILLSTLKEIKREGGEIVGIGAPAKGNTLLNFCGITSELVSALLEKSPLKIGVFAPGSHIPVLSEDLLSMKQPAFALILSWNLADELISKARANGYAGRFIIPFPQVHIV